MRRENMNLQLALDAAAWAAAQNERVRQAWRQAAGMKSREEDQLSELDALLAAFPNDADAKAVAERLRGTIAEELVYGEIANGATSDLQKANNIARRMVAYFGMSRLGRVFYPDGEEPTFLRGSGLGGSREFSEQTAREIDMEVRDIIHAAVEEVRQVLYAEGTPPTLKVEDAKNAFNRAERDKQKDFTKKIETLKATSTRDHQCPSA